MALLAKSELLKSKRPLPLIPQCGVCGLFRGGCKSPKMEVAGRGRKKILIVGEAPGRQEDERGKPFVGKAGQYMQNVLGELDINMWADCWLYNSLICRPPNNATPTDNQITYCAPNVQRLIKSFRPRVIIMVGLSAVQSILKPTWRDSVGSMGRWVGWCIPSQHYNAWLCPTYHPSFVLRELDSERSGTVVPKLFQRHLARATGIHERPWTSVPKWSEDVEVILDPREAAKRLRRFRKRGGAIAFDYETNCLKPDGEFGPSIRSIAVCWNGKETIAFPAQQDAYYEFIKLLESPCPKISHNLQFEDRWTSSWMQRKWRRVERHSFRAPKRLYARVNNWAWDTMIMAHLLDNREGITSLAFQSFVMLGMGSYSEHINEFLRAENSYDLNKINDISWNDLLVYNGLDALLTWKIAAKQRAKLRLGPFG